MVRFTSPTRRHSICEWSFRVRSSNANPVFSLCGPPNFVVDVVAQLKAHGVPEDRIHYELFTAGSPA